MVCFSLSNIKLDYNKKKKKKNAFCVSGASEGTISMEEGEVLAVVEEDKGDGWTRVRRQNGDEGYIPTSYVTITLNK